MTGSRSYPDRPLVAVSAAIFRNDTVLIVRRAQSPGKGIYTLPGGVVETGETLTDAVIREAREETGLVIRPIALAGYRDVIVRDSASRVVRHFVVLCFASKWLSGEPVVNHELSEAAWRDPDRLGELATTEGLGEIIAQARAIVAADGD